MLISIAVLLSKSFPTALLMHRLHNSKLQKGNVLSVKKVYRKKSYRKLYGIVYVYVSFQLLVISQHHEQACHMPKSLDSKKYHEDEGLKNYKSLRYFCAFL